MQSLKPKEAIKSKYQTRMVLNLTAGHTQMHWEVSEACLLPFENEDKYFKSESPKCKDNHVKLYHHCTFHCWLSTLERGWKRLLKSPIGTGEKEEETDDKQKGNKDEKIRHTEKLKWIIVIQTSLGEGFSVSKSVVRCVAQAATRRAAKNIPSLQVLRASLCPPTHLLTQLCFPSLSLSLLVLPAPSLHSESPPLQQSPALLKSAWSPPLPSPLLVPPPLHPVRTDTGR